jgi:hypothetical protein
LFLTVGLRSWQQAQFESVYGKGHFNYHNWHSTIGEDFVDLSLGYEMSGTVGFCFVIYNYQERKEQLKMPKPPLPRDICNQFLVAFQEFVESCNLLDLA